MAYTWVRGKGTHGYVLQGGAYLLAKGEKEVFQLGVVWWTWEDWKMKVIRAYIVKFPNNQYQYHYVWGEPGNSIEASNDFEVHCSLSQGAGC